MLVLGLTGGIGSGKSTVSKMLLDKGAVILDADAYAREIVLPGSAVLKELTAEFGEHILASDGTLNRKRLAQLAFRNDESKNRLDAIMHGAIKNMFRERLMELESSEFDGVAVIDAPLLYTAGLHEFSDVVWVVTLSEEERIKRVVSRDNIDIHDVLKRIELQKKEEELHKNADLFIDNSGSVDDLSDLVDAEWHNLRHNGRHKSKRSVRFSATALVLLIIFSCAYLLSGCDTANSFDFFKKNSAETKEIKSKEILIPSAKIDSLNPILINEEDEYYISKLIYGSLFSLDETMRPVPDIAEEVLGYEDNILELRLRKGILWHDGSELTANDVKYSVAQYKSAAERGAGIFGEHVHGIKKVSLDKNDPYKVYIHYERKQDMSKSKLTFPIVKYSASAGEKSKKKSTFSPVGTGPYKLSEYNEGRDIRLEPNERYYEHVPGNVLIFKMLPDKNYADNLVKANAISCFFNMTTQDIIAMGDTEHNSLRFPSNRVEFLGFNCENALLSDKKIRHAIAYAIDTSELCESAYYSASKPTDGLFYPGFWGIENEGDGYGYSKKKSNKAISKAGFAEIHGILQDSNQNHLKLELIYNSDNQSRAIAAAMIVEWLKDVKIECSAVPLSYAEYISRINSGKYDMYIGGAAFADYYDLRPFLMSDHNKFNYKNHMLDKRLGKMYGEINDYEFIGNYKFVKKQLQKDLPCYPLLYKEYEMIYPDSLIAEPNPLFNNLYKDCADWKHIYKVKIDPDEKKAS